MSLNSLKILGVNITIDNEEKILEELRKYLQVISNKRKVISKKLIKPLIIFTPNPEIINYAQKDSIFKEIVNSAQINLPDGAGVIWAVDRTYGEKIRRISGADFVMKLVKTAAEKGFTVGIIGGRGGLAVEACECLRKEFPGVKIEVLGEPEVKLVSSIKYQVSSIKKKNKKIHNTKYIILNTKGDQIDETNKYFENLVKKIEQRKVDLLFVGLGFPKQEYFISQLKVISDKRKVKRPLVMMGVGGSLEYVAGRVKRAPSWMQRAGLEWLYRLMAEPWRIKRQMIGAEFFLRVLWQKLLF